MFSNIHKQGNTLKSSKLHGRITRVFLGLRMRNFQILSLCELEHIGRFSNLHWCTFNLLHAFSFAHMFCSSRESPTKKWSVSRRISLSLTNVSAALICSRFQKKSLMGELHFFGSGWNRDCIYLFIYLFIIYYFL